MKRSIIKEMICGVDYHEKIKETNEYKILTDNIVNELTEINNEISSGLKERLNKLIDLFGYRTADSADTYYTEGFKLGLLVGMECAEELNNKP